MFTNTTQTRFSARSLKVFAAALVALATLSIAGPAYADGPSHHHHATRAAAFFGTVTAISPTSISVARPALTPLAPTSMSMPMASSMTFVITAATKVTEDKLSVSHIDVTVGSKVTVDYTIDNTTPNAPVDTATSITIFAPPPLPLTITGRLSAASASSITVDHALGFGRRDKGFRDDHALTAALTSATTVTAKDGTALATSDLASGQVVKVTLDATSTSPTASSVVILTEPRLPSVTGNVTAISATSITVSTPGATPAATTFAITAATSIEGPAASLVTGLAIGTSVHVDPIRAATPGNEVAKSIRVDAS